MASYQAISKTNVDFSSPPSSDIHLNAISQKIPGPLMIKISLKIADKEFYSNPTEAKELTWINETFCE